MVGYGAEDTHFVVELTYNYNVNSYELGNDFLGITISSSEAIANAKNKSWPTESKDGYTVIKAPDGYPFLLLDEPQSTDKGERVCVFSAMHYRDTVAYFSRLRFLPLTDPVKKISLASSNLQNSVKYWNETLGLKLLKKEEKSALFTFDEKQTSLELVDIGER